ncbi:MAG: DNA polymerase III subunit gamma/tau [Lachnospiraceae bacterium]|nr:DNA polymerase III subunit gamma/tau [Lachnospiraceae bacterium]
MSYIALYRKFRPDTFADVKGQDSIVTTLKNQIVNDRVGHAYLFCGTRGTGKTTIAKILGKAINCENPQDGNPCGCCESCRAIQEGRSMNLIEIDAASNNGVDNIREIRDEVQYSPTSGKYKVYIIDEVHMLSAGAFNALLKTLEEPPAYVVFILATTEAHKIPVTILSRCQRYDFKRIGIETIAGRMKELMAVEGNDVEDRALSYIAKAADGSMRDALSLLDQCLAFHMNERLTYDHVLDVLGAVDNEVFSELLRRVISYDTAGCIYQLEDLVMQGRDLTQLVVDFTWYLRNLLLIKTSDGDNVEDVLDVSSDTLAALKEEAEMVDAESLMRYIRIFSELSTTIKYSTQKRVMFELALIKLTHPAMEQNYDSILQRMNALEQKLEELEKHGVKVEALSATPSTTAIDAASLGPLERIEPILPSQQDMQEIKDRWPEILRQMSDQGDANYRGYIAEASVNVGRDQEIVLGDLNDMMTLMAGKEECRQAIKTAVEAVMGKNFDFQITILSSDMLPESVGLRRQIISHFGNIPVEQEDMSHTTYED